MREFILHMQIAKRSPVTVKARVECVERLRRHLAPDVELLAASTDDLIGFQATYAHLAPASVDIYTRHIQAFYRWATVRGYIDVDPSVALALPVIRKGRPHPTAPEDLKIIFACTLGGLRKAYALATFAGLRCGEIARLENSAIDYHTNTALIVGKGGKERIVPLLPAVIAEIRGDTRRGRVVTLRNGGPYTPNRLSVDSHKHLREIGVETTLHSMRHTFATNAARLTRDPLLVRDLLGHGSVQTTEIYMDSDMTDAHRRLAGVGEDAAKMLNRRLRAV